MPYRNRGLYRRLKRSGVAVASQLVEERLCLTQLLTMGDGEGVVAPVQAAQHTSCEAVSPGDGVFLNGSTLWIAGTNADDQIRTREKSNRLRVVVNGDQTRWDREDVDHIGVCGFAGHDSIDRDGNTSIPSYIEGGDGNDSIQSGDGADEVLGGAGDDSIRGNGGNDLLRGGGGHDWVYGNQGNDYLSGGGGRDRLSGGNGHDTMMGLNAPDRLFGGRGKDVLDGGAGTDRLEGGVGSDILDGGADSDSLFGNTGHDLTIGGTGSDRVNGGFGDDLLIGDAVMGIDVEALRSILDEWTNNDHSLSQRVDNIRGLEPADDRLNGTAHLDLATLVSDQEADRLKGQVGTDWFFAIAPSATVATQLGEQDFEHGRTPLTQRTQEEAGVGEPAPFDGTIFGHDARVGQLGRFSYTHTFELGGATISSAELTLGLIDHDSFLTSEDTIDIFFNGVQQDETPFLGISIRQSSASVVTIPVAASLLSDGTLTVEVIATTVPGGNTGNSVGPDFSRLVITVPADSVQDGVDILRDFRGGTDVVERF